MKTTQLAHALFVLCLCLLSPTVFGQNNSGNWTLLHEEKGVQFFGMDTYCSNDAEEKANHYAFLKIVNTNSQSVKLNFGFALEFEEGCSGCDQDSEFFIALDLPAQTTLEGDCSEQNGRLSRIIRNLNVPGGWKYRSMTIAHPIID